MSSRLTAAGGVEFLGCLPERFLGLEQLLFKFGDALGELAVGELGEDVVGEEVIGDESDAFELREAVLEGS